MKTLSSHIILVFALTFVSDTHLNAFGNSALMTTQNEQSTTDRNLDEKIKVLQEAMISYLNEVKPSYTRQDIDACLKILNKYRSDIAKTKSRTEGMNVVKAAILQLNKLNNKCQGALIETGEREQITQIIILAGHEKGYNTIDEDITEQWREW